MHSVQSDTSPYNRFVAQPQSVFKAINQNTNAILWASTVNLTEEIHIRWGAITVRDLVDYYWVNANNKSEDGLSDFIESVRRYSPNWPKVTLM